MATRLYVGNLSQNTTNEDLRDAFAEYGQVVDSAVTRDRETGLSRGFAIVTFANRDEADIAITALNEQDFNGRRIKVEITRAYH